MNKTLSKTWERYKPREEDRDNFAHFYNTRSSIGLVERPKVKSNYKGQEFYIVLNPRYYIEDLTYKKKARKEYELYKKQGIVFPKYEEEHKNFYYKFNGEAYNSNLKKYAKHILLLKKNVRMETIKNYCEIGSGYGGMVEMLILNTPIKNYYLIDIPETLEISRVWLKRHNNIHFISTEEFKQVSGADFPNIDLFLNVNSFGEMKYSQIKNYFDWIQTFNNCYLFSSNNLVRQEGDETLRALYYPYDNNWITTFEQTIGKDTKEIYERLSMRGFNNE